MKERFYVETLQRLLNETWLHIDHDVLVVAGGPADHEVLLAVGLRNATISNLDDRMRGDEFAPFRCSFKNAEELD